MNVKPLQLKLFFSNKYAYAQIVRMLDGNIVAAASTIEKGTREGLTGSGVDKEACQRVGQVIAQRALKNGIEGVHWDRKRNQKFHGRIAALITAMRDAGMKFV